MNSMTAVQQLETELGQTAALAASLESQIADTKKAIEDDKTRREFGLSRPPASFDQARNASLKEMQELHERASDRSASLRRMIDAEQKREEREEGDRVRFQNALKALEPAFDRVRSAADVLTDAVFQFCHGLQDHQVNVNIAGLLYPPENPKEPLERVDLRSACANQVHASVARIMHEEQYGQFRKKKSK